MADLYAPLQKGAVASTKTRDTIRAGLARRHARERRFRAYGIAAICAALGAVVILFAMILTKGLPAFTQANVQLEVFFDPEVIKVAPKPEIQPGQSLADGERARLTWERQVTMVNWN